MINFKIIAVLASMILFLNCGEKFKDGSSGQDENNSNGKRFDPAENPPQAGSDESKIVITNPGIDFDFTGASAVSSFAENELALQSSTEFQKITGDGNLESLSNGSKIATKLKKSPKNALLVTDDQSNQILISSDGTETQLGNVKENIQAGFGGDGVLYFESADDEQIYKIKHGSTTPEKLTSYPWDSMAIRNTTGSAITYEGRKGNNFQSFTYFQGVNFTFNDGSPPPVALGDKGLIFSDDIKDKNFASYDGKEIIKKKIDGLDSYDGGFYHPEGAVIFVYGLSVLDEEVCPDSPNGIVFVDTDLNVKPIGCTPSGASSSVEELTMSGNLFVMKGTSEVWVYGINSWQQKLLDGFTPINISLAGTTLYYDGMDISGKYIVGTIDVITKEKVDLNLDGTVVDLIGFK